MRPSDALRQHRAEIRREVARNHATNPRVFGSVLRGHDSEGSDLDLLVDTTPETSLLDIARLQNSLEAMLGTKVDVLTPMGLPADFRERVLAEARPV